MPDERQRILEERKQLKAQFGELFDAVAAILFRHDPAGINFDVNTDEYEPEVGTILARLASCKSPEDVMKAVHDEFVNWFDPTIAGPLDRYRDLAIEIWGLWEKQRHEQNRPPTR